MKNVLIGVACCLVFFVIGGASGYYFSKDHYNELMQEQAKEYEKAVQAARNKEQTWIKQNAELEQKYIKQLEKVKSDNSVIVDRLRKQLSQASSRMSSNSSTSSSSSDRTRAARLSREVEHLVEFSERCARRADELIVQLSSLQEWSQNISK